MDSFRDDYKGHMIFTHASGPQSGPWVGSFSAWSIDKDGLYECVSQSIASDSCHSEKFAERVALTDAKKRIDKLLAPAQAAAAAIARAASCALTWRMSLRAPDGSLLADPVFFPSRVSSGDQGVVLPVGGGAGV